MKVQAPTKSTVETVKTVVIAVLVTGIIAFVSGMHYEKSVQGNIDVKVQAVTASKTVKN